MRTDRRESWGRERIGWSPTKRLVRRKMKGIERRVLRGLRKSERSGLRR